MPIREGFLGYTKGDGFVKEDELLQEKRELKVRMTAEQERNYEHVKAAGKSLMAIKPMAASNWEKQAVELERRQLISQIPMVEKHGAYAGEGAVGSNSAPAWDGSIGPDMTATRAIKSEALTKERLDKVIKDFQKSILTIEHALVYGGLPPWYFKNTAPTLKHTPAIIPLKRKEPIEVSIPKPSNVRTGNGNRQAVFLSGCGEMTPLEAETLAKELFNVARRARDDNAGPKVRKLGDY